MMTEYFALISEDDRRGPFDSITVPIALLKQISRERGYSDVEARDFFLHRSAIEEVETVGGKSDSFRVGWLAREEAGREVDPQEGIEHSAATVAVGRYR